MNAASMKRGRCPGAFSPMESGDGLVLRARPPRGRIAINGLCVLADLGTDGFETTRRGNLQFRGLDAAGVARAQSALGRLGWIDAASRRETPCDIWLSPYAGEDPDERGDAIRFHDALVAALAAPGAPKPPAKFAFALDAGGATSPSAAEADVMVRIDGERFAAIGRGETGAFARGRMDDFGKILAPAFELRTSEALRRTKSAGWRPPLGAHRVGARVYVGFAATFGAVSRALAGEIADVAAMLGIAELRQTPSRIFVAPAPDRPSAERFARDLAGLDLVVSAGDPRGRAEACVGAPHCPRATTRTREHALSIVAALGVAAPAIHVSGCAKGCAHPGIAAATLVASDGAYGLAFDAAPGDEALARGLDARAAAAAVAGRFGTPLDGH